MRMMPALIALLLSCTAASASGGLDCDADDARASFTLHGGVTRGMGGGMFDFRGELEIKDKAISEDLRKTAFERQHVAQYWFDAEDLRLDIYREREGDKAHGYVELIVMTKVGADAIAFEGTYELIVFDTANAEGSEGKETKITGKTSCFTE